MINFLKNNTQLFILTGLVIFVSFILAFPSTTSAVSCTYDCNPGYPYRVSVCSQDGCFSFCPAGNCCCQSDSLPWCCYDAGYSKPTNCSCPPPYCCPGSSPVLCDGSCYPAGTQCSSCNGQLLLFPPTLISPSNGATDVSTTPTLDWSDVVGANGWYNLYYKKSSETSWSVKSNLSYSRYTFSSGALASFTTYQWNVRACNPGPVCEDSETWSFTTGVAPPTMTCPDCAPPKYLNDVVHLTVSATNEVIGISQLCLGIKKEGQAKEDLCYECGGAASCTHTWSVTLDFSGTDPNTVDWVIYGIAQYTNGQWGAWVGPIIIEEVIGAAPLTVTTEIADVNLQNNQATLKGNVTNTGGENPSQRVLEWGTSSGSYTNSHDCGSGGTGEFSYTISLTPETIYYYRAKAYNSGGWGYGSEKQVVIYEASGGQQQFTTPKITYALTVTKADTGSGTVTDTGINCGADCLETYDSGTTVILTAFPDTGSYFAGWSGDCTGTGTCTLTMDADKSVTATFKIEALSRTLTGTITGTGSGTVTVIAPTGAIDHKTDFTETYDVDTSVTLAVTPDSGSYFAGWSGDCTGTGTCTLTMDSDKSVTATFNIIDSPPQITISCPECAEIKNIGDVVSVTVSATDDYGLDQLYFVVGGDREGSALPDLWDDYYNCAGATSCSHTWDITLDAFGPDINSADWTFWGNAEDTGGQWSDWALAYVWDVFDFNLSVSPNSGSMNQGQSVSATVTANLVSPATRSVSFSASGLPSGASASFSPTSCSPACDSIMTITTSTTTPTGTSTITIKGENGNLVRTTTYNLTVTGACPLSNSTCSSPEGSISCGGTLSGCLNASDWKHYSVPDSAGKEVTVTLTMSGTDCNSNDLYIYDSSCNSIDVGSGNLWTETWTGTPTTDIIIGIDGDSTNANCFWDLSVDCVELCTRANPGVSLSPSSQTGNPGQTLSYTAIIINYDSSDCGASTFNLTKSCPSGWTCSLSASSVTVSPDGSSNAVSLSATSPTTATAGNYTVSVTATNSAATSYSGTGSATYQIVVTCPLSNSTCSSPEGSISCGGTLSGCLNASDWKHYSVPDSAGKEVTVTLTFSGTGCNVNDLYVYNSNCTSIYVGSGNLWTETWTGTPTTDIKIGVDGDSSNPNCQWDLSVDCVLPLYPLTVSKAGTGSGTVTSSPSGINCGTDCSESYSSGTSVTLTATPDSGSEFFSWSGCLTMSGNICEVTINESKTVTATFNLSADTTPPVTIISPNGKDWGNSDVNFTLSCDDGAGSGCQTTQYKIIDQSQSCDISGLINGTSSTVTCPAGQTCQKKVCFRSIDNENNEEPIKTSNLFKVDKTKPTSTITSPPAGSTQNTDFLVSVSDTDTGGSGLNICYYRTYDSVEGYTRSWAIRTCNSSQLITVGSTADCRTIGGTCTVYVYSYDNAGNQGDINNRSFNIGEVLIGEAPICTYLSADPTEGPAPLTVSFIGSGSDPDGTIAAYQWDFGDAAQDTITTITDYFDTNNPDSNPEYYIASKENLTVSGGEVRLKEKLEENGEPCSSPSECLSGYCVNGVCCNTACNDQTCQRCDSYSNAGAGTCGYVSSSFEDPGNECSQGSTTSDGCRSNYCSGIDYSCGVQTSGDGGCPSCNRCRDSNIACEYYPDNAQDPTGCSGTCEACQSGECGIATDETDPGDICGNCVYCISGDCTNVAECKNCYGCTGSCNWCYNGVCKSCSWSLLRERVDYRCYSTGGYDCKPSRSGKAACYTASSRECYLQAGSSTLQSEPGTTVYSLRCDCQ